MTSHELARKLLEGPDAPIDVQVNGPIGTIWSDENREVSVQLGGDSRIRLVGHTDCYFDLLDEDDLIDRGYRDEEDDDEASQ